MQFDTRRKIVDVQRAAAEARRMQMRGGRVVFTNGCFDVLHAGHVRYLAQARWLGDLLIVGLNSDASVRSLNKGPDRPLNPQDQRAEVLSALAAVDFVVIFPESTPAALIEEVRPDLLIKGGDWPVEQIVGWDLVETWGGTTMSIPLVEGISTTGLVERIRGKGEA